MNSGTERRTGEARERYHEIPLSKFLAGRATPVAGYTRLGNGQLLREDTWRRWQSEGRVR